MMRRILALASLTIVAASAAAAAQEHPPTRLRLEPYVGAFNDSYDISPDARHKGVHAGLRLGYELREGTRLLATGGYASTENVSDPNGLKSYFVYDNTWALTVLGAEHDVIRGTTAVAIGLQAGAGWRRNDLTGRVGDPPAHTDWYGGDGFSAIDVVVPSLTLRRSISARTALLLSVQDQIFDVLEGPANHSPAFSVGLSLR